MGIKIDCKSYHAERLELTSKHIQEVLKNEGAKEAPRFLLASIGEDDASQVYMRGKSSDCEKAGITCVSMKLTDENSRSAASELRLELLVGKYDGAMLQLPVPTHMDSSEIIKVITPDIDVDGLTRGSNFTQCTPLGIINLLEYSNVTIEGKVVVIVGRSSIVGRPLSDLMIQKGATVISCNSKTKNLEKFTRQADILVSATGVAGLITPNHISDGVVLIDVGITRGKGSKKICGDISTDCYDKSSMYTTVPGGIGLVTRVTLIDNIVKSWDYHRELI